MSRDKRASAQHTLEDQQSIAAFLRGLATRAELDASFAAQLADALRESGLAARVARVDGVHRVRRSTSPSVAEASVRTTAQGHLPDPFTLLRDHGESGLRVALEALDLAQLRALVRGHRLDPARVSARWTTRERVIALIVQQVRARADLGKAFARV